MKKKTRIALVGAGGIGKIWAEAIKKTKNVELAVVVDVNIDAAKTIAVAFPDCIVTSEWKDVLKDENVDALLVATPHKFLAPIAFAALSAGKHVFSEKPCGMNAREIMKNVAIAKKKKRVYMPGFNHRYHAGYLKAREIFEAGGIGKILFIRARYGFGGRPGYNKEWRFKKAIAGGGELFDQGIHMIDMARWFMGDFKDINGFAENMFWGGDVEDNGFALLRTKSGKVASIHVSWTNWEWVHSFEVYGDKGYLVIDGLDRRYRGPEQLIWGRRDPTFAHPEETKYVFSEETKFDSLHRELEAFAGAVAGAKTKIPRGEDVYEAMKIIEMIYKKSHARTGK
jgi:predicted dehydrogenase